MNAQWRAAPDRLKSAGGDNEISIMALMALPVLAKGNPRRENGGEGWIRTSVGEANGFTVRPL